MRCVGWAVDWLVMRIEWRSFMNSTSKRASGVYFFLGFFFVWDHPSVSGSHLNDFLRNWPPPLWWESCDEKFTAKLSNSNGMLWNEDEWVEKVKAFSWWKLLSRSSLSTIEIQPCSHLLNHATDQLSGFDWNERCQSPTAPPPKTKSISKWTP